MSLLPDERFQTILDHLRRDGRVLVAEVARALAVSGETVRRDLLKLEEAGLLRRCHGGALPAPPPQGEDLPFPARSVLNIAAKRRIAALAAAEVRDGEAIMLDSSSTVHEIVRPLGARRGLTLVTNSVALLSDPHAMPHQLLSVGGEWRRELMTFAGPLAVEAIRRFRADRAFISVKALSPDGGLLVANAEDAALKRAFIDSAARTVLLVDGDKFDGPGLLTAAPLHAVDRIVTDRLPDERWRAALDDAGVALDVAS
ncbi:DeoR family transcriptional regulator [Aureimonas endophytica]|uniref:DeoR family transcriptional regulator n=1 Tax=Aureimonas endophytica TaxID=2027858 RepID=A0A917A419_9HYPH|nr:DeoR/GlpR family DNA-binding transcription regulator [Aureimonas endophytica]GGE22711.1 DeoR family transcriptional regulator [Aureimonas endophytica]